MEWSANAWSKLSRINMTNLARAPYETFLREPMKRNLAHAPYETLPRQPLKWKDPSAQHVVVVYHHIRIRHFFNPTNMCLLNFQVGWKDEFDLLECTQFHFGMVKMLGTRIATKASKTCHCQGDNLITEHQLDLICKTGTHDFVWWDFFPWFCRFLYIHVCVPVCVFCWITYW